MMSRTLLDEIQEALERAYDPESSSLEQYQALATVKDALWGKKEALLAVVRASDGVLQESLRQADGDPESLTPEEKDLYDTLRTLDPRLLGES